MTLQKQSWFEELMQPVKDAIKLIPGGKTFARWYRRPWTISQIDEIHLKLEDHRQQLAELRLLRERVQFLLDDSINTRRQLRHLVAEHPSYLSQIQQTAGSFDFQWDKLPEGEYLLSNDTFHQAATQTVCQYTGFSPEWFRGKRVLDAGCGNGRFSWAMAKMGALVTSLDLSPHGLEHLRKAAARDGLELTTICHNLLEPLPLTGPFDLVWSYGVLHHTGDTYRAFKHVHPLVGAGGYLFLMLYGDPRWNFHEDFVELTQYERLRRLTRNKPMAEKIEILKHDSVVMDVHGWFDAISPAINDLYSFDEIETWLVEAGFIDIRETVASRNLHIIARRAAQADAGRSADHRLPPS